MAMAEKGFINRSLKVNGKEYPCRVTMGAMVRFKRETGRDVSTIKESDISDLVLFMWCCVVSASKADGIEFGMSFEDFADSLEGTELQAFLLSMDEDASTGTKKKTTKK